MNHTVWSNLLMNLLIILKLLNQLLIFCSPEMLPLFFVMLAVRFLTRTLDTTVQYMQSLILTRINNFVTKEIFGNMMREITTYSNNVTDFDWLSLKSDNVNIFAENVASKNLEFCSFTIPNNVITVRPLRPPWINSEFRKKK